MKMNSPTENDDADERPPRPLIIRRTKPARANKYGAVRTGGHDSAAEHWRAKQLRLLQAAGEITGLREQVWFNLIPAQRDEDGQLLERACRYRADFAYTLRDGREVVEDVKGVRTPEYKIKKKLMLWIHGIEIKET